MKKSLFILPAIFFYCSSPQAPKGDSADQAFQTFIDQFEPSSGGGETNDLSAASYQLKIDQIRGQVEELRKIDTAGLSFENKIDWQFAMSILRGQDIRLSQHQKWKKDPRVYMPFRNLANIIGKPGEIADKVANLEEPLGLVPQHLSNGQ